MGYPYVINPMEHYRDFEEGKEYVRIVASNDFIAYTPGEHDVFLTPRSHSSMAFSEELVALMMAGAPLCSVGRSDAFMFIPIAYAIRFSNSAEMMDFLLMFDDHDDYEVSAAK
jgi:hypothetical protein